MTVAQREVVTSTEEERAVVRYSFFDRILHWFVGATFVYLLLSGFALGYPRMAWLYDLLGGGQTVRFLHPIVGVAFTVGVVIMIVAWVRDMLFTAVDRVWTRNVKSYALRGHVDLDVGRYNAGQKGYFWVSVIAAVLLLLTGIPLWFPGLLGSGPNLVARLIHHAVFLIAFGAFIIHVYMSTALYPGSAQSMISGRVTPAWAAWHHPAWYRKHEKR